MMYIETPGFWLVVSVIYLLLTFRRQPMKNLDRVLLWWTKRDPFRLRDLLNGGLLFLGMTGVGKTSTSGTRVGRAVVADCNSYGLILAAKPEDLPMWHQIFHETGQSERLLVFDGEKSPLRFNFLEEAARHGDAREITKMITIIGETLTSGDRGRGGENAAFFHAQQERVIHHSVELLLAAHGKVTSNDLQRFIATAATSRQQIGQEDWRSQFHNRCIQAAYTAPLSPRRRHDIEQAIDFWCGEWSGMAERMRSSILAGVMGTLFVFNNGLVHELVSSTSNFTLEDLRRKRQWLLVNMAPSEHGESGRFVGAGFKYFMQRHVLRTPAGVNDPFHVVWCDEAQNWTNQYDAEYLAQCRSHRGCMVYLTQSIHSFHTAMRSEDSKHQTLSLLGNFSHRIIHALGDVETAQWASDTLGKQLQTHFGGSTQPAESVFDEFFGVDRTTSSHSEQYAPVLQPNEFMNGLRTGGPGNRFLSDAILIRPGVPFSNGENFLFLTFSQR